jgi:nucleoside-diphosphate-sugar epimerase
VLLSGTVTQTGIPKHLPVNETHCDDPITIYDLHKQMAEGYLKYYARQGFVRGAILRLANVYGPGPKTSSAERGLLNIMIRKALAGETLTVYGEGNYLRDFVYVSDVVGAFVLAGAKIGRVNGRHFVVGSGRGRTIAEAVNVVAERVALKTGHRARVVHIDPPRPALPIESRDFVADPGSLAETAGWHPRTWLAEGIDLTIDYYLNQPKERL